jgi:hypothetical protein
MVFVESRSWEAFPLQFCRRSRHRSSFDDDDPLPDYERA